MKKRFALFAGTILFFTPTPIESRKSSTNPTQGQSAAELSDGNALLRDCTSALRVADGTPSKSPDDLSGAMYCTGYVAGFVDAHVLTVGLNSGKMVFCQPPSGIRVDQDIRIIIKYLQDHPEKLHESGRILVMMALRSAFPCD